MRIYKRRTPRLGFGNSYFKSTLFALLIVPAFSLAAPDWKYEKAPIRFTVSPEGKPSHPECGYTVHLPDGGILPRPFPQPAAVDAGGNVLKSYILWQNNETGVLIPSR